MALQARVLLVGVAAGLLARSRWAILAAWVLHLAGFELAHATGFQVAGVLFGPVALDTTAGIALFILGHGLYALVIAPPMALGAVGGAAQANPAMILVSGLLILAWRNAGWYGLDRWVLPSRRRRPRRGTGPCRPG